MQTTTLDLAIAKADKLPKEVQEHLGREVLFRIKSLEELRGQLHVGIDELDTGKGAAIEIDAVLGEARRQHGEAA